MNLYLIIKAVNLLPVRHEFYCFTLPLNSILRPIAIVPVRFFFLFPIDNTGSSATGPRSSASGAAYLLHPLPIPPIRCFFSVMLVHESRPRPPPTLEAHDGRGRLHRRSHELVRRPLRRLSREITRSPLSSHPTLSLSQASLLGPDFPDARRASRLAAPARPLPSVRSPAL